MRRFEFSAGGSDKFWEIEIEGNDVTVRYGRIGTHGLSQTKNFADATTAKKEHDKLVAEKLKKGYVEVGAAPSPAGDQGSQPATVSGSARRSAESLKKVLAAANVDLSTFERVSVNDDDDDEDGGKKRNADDGFFMLTVPKSRVLEIWRAMRASTDQTGYYPIITEDHDTLFEYLENFDFDDDNGPQNPAAMILKHAGAIDAPKWIEKRVEDDEEMFGDRDEGGEDDWRPHSEASNAQSADDYYVIQSNGGDTSTMIFCPTKTPWHVAAVLGWGGSNDGIEPWEHVAMHKYWHSKYGAEPVCVTLDIWEFAVAKPPKSREDAVALANEQFVYCPDIVDQGCGTILGLASEIVHSPRWYFWWD
jgi:predicted DNA-binding WGR domain protein